MDSIFYKKSPMKPLKVTDGSQKFKIALGIGALVILAVGIGEILKRLDLIIQLCQK